MDRSYNGSQKVDLSRLTEKGVYTRKVDRGLVETVRRCCTCPPGTRPPLSGLRSFGYNLTAVRCSDTGSPVSLLYR